MVHVFSNHVTIIVTWYMCSITMWPLWSKHTCVLTKFIEKSIIFPRRFSVEFTGYPPPVIQWFREGFEIQTSRDFQIMTTPTRSTLYIPEVFPEDTGMFTVKIHNQYGMAQCKAMLQVQGMTTSLYHYKFIGSRISLTLKGSVNLKCQYTEYS